MTSDSSFSISGSLGSDGEFSWTTILALLGGSVSFVVALVNGIAAYYRDKQTQNALWSQERRFEQFKKDLEDRQRRLVRFENVQELMKQYKKPLLQSAFDLQSRLANQVKQNFLHVFIHQRENERDKDYARYNFAFVIAEFLGWLEVIRQEIVFITGQEDSMLLSALVDAIKFQFTGETPVQGVPPKGCEGDSEYDRNSSIMQLYAGELRAIGEVMIQKRGDDGPGNQNLNCIGYAEFVRRMTKESLAEAGDPDLLDQYETCEKFMQESLAPLLEHIDNLASLIKGDAPTHRLAILQVLLCRLIDMLDNAVPWDAGRKYDLEAGEEPQYIPRDFRITPLVAYLNVKQKQWLSTQPFMATADMYVDDPNGQWLERMSEVDTMYRKLCFCGFREDMAGKSVEEREKGADTWPGCFPPRAPRRRPLHWWLEQGLFPPYHVGPETQQEQKGLRKLWSWTSSRQVPKSASLRQRSNAKAGAEAALPSMTLQGGRVHSMAPPSMAAGASMARAPSAVAAAPSTPGGGDHRGVTFAASTGGNVSGGRDIAPQQMIITAEIARATTLQRRQANNAAAVAMQEGGHASAANSPPPPGTTSSASGAAPSSPPKERNDGGVREEAGAGQGLLGSGHFSGSGTPSAAGAAAGAPAVSALVALPGQVHPGTSTACVVELSAPSSAASSSRSSASLRVVSEQDNVVQDLSNH